MDETRTLNILRGLPGSGKSTFSEEWVAVSPTTRTRINRDLIRANYYNSYWGESVDELAVARIEKYVTEQVMSDGKRDITIDATNLQDLYVIELLILANRYGYAVEFIDFNVEVDELVHRDSLRDRKVGEEIIRRFAATYLVDGVIPPPPSLPAMKKLV